MHKWWAQRPLAAARAVIFAQLVNDPSWKWELENPGKVPPGHLKGSWQASRNRLFKIIEDLVRWENTANEEVLERARSEIQRSWREVCELNRDHPDALKLFDRERRLTLHDPFVGGGTIPLEAQRLGLETCSSDLNPVAVLISKAIIEIPSKFAGRHPIGPISNGGQMISTPKTWPGLTGLAEDLLRYGSLMVSKAEKRIGRFYPTVHVTEELAVQRADLRNVIGQKLPVIAWLWARTVKSPNPAFCHVDVPLVSNFVISSKAGKKIYVEPVIQGASYKFNIKAGNPPSGSEKGTTAGKRAAFICLMSNTPIDYNYIRTEGRAGRIGHKLMAIVAKSRHGRLYLPPTQEMESIATKIEPEWKPNIELPDNPRDIKTPNYGLTTFSDLFSSRQLLASTTFSSLIGEMRENIQQDAIASGMSDDGKALREGGIGAMAYAEALSIYLSFAVDKYLMYGNSFVPWYSKEDRPSMLFSRQALPMVWDYVEINPFSDIGGSLGKSLEIVAGSLNGIAYSSPTGIVTQQDAASGSNYQNVIVSTDPPYYDNIGYADLSDYFYIWLRPALRPVFPDLFATVTVPKAEELVATPYRHSSKENAETFFLNGMKRAMRRLSEQSHPAFPVTVYYAFKQSENGGADGISSSGWETFLEALMDAGFALTGTWPMRTERQGRMIGNEKNALASSIVLVCRKRSAEAQTISRRQFLRELNAVLPEALDEMTKGSGDDRSPVAPVDLSQAIIGPGMAVFSKYASVLEADGSPMTVRTALTLINRFLAEDDFDADTQFCLHWFEQNGWKEGLYGDADTLSRAKGTSVDGMRDGGIVESGGGIVRLCRWSEYPSDWNPEKDSRNSVWESLHHIIRALKQEGEAGSGRLLGELKDKSEAARQLAYRLYTLCERQGWAEDARAYNEVITSWSGIETAASATAKPAQGELFEQDI